MLNNGAFQVCGKTTSSDAVNLDAAGGSKRAHAGVVGASAGAADGDDCVGVCIRQRRRQVAR